MPSTIDWIGAAQDVAQVTRITFSAYTAGVTYKLTINGKTVSYLAAASTSSDVWAGLVAAWEASPIAEIQEATATVSTGVLLTGDTAGKPFTVSASTDGAPTATVTSVTAATGKNSRTNAANWLGGVVPGAGDSMRFRNCSVSMLYDLVDTGVNYGDIIVEASFTGAIGLPSETGQYREYRARFLKLGSSATYKVRIGQGQGSQPSRVMIDGNANTLQVQVYGTQSANQNERPVIIKNTSNTSTYEYYGGYCQMDGDTTSSAASVKIIAQSGQTCDVLATETVACGVITTTGGNLEVRGSATSLDANNGSTVTIASAATCPTIKSASGASVFWCSTAGVTTSIESRKDGTIDFGRHGSAKAVQASTVFSGGKILDPLGIITWTNKILFSGCTAQECTVDFGRNKSIGT